MDTLGNSYQSLLGIGPSLGVTVIGLIVLAAFAFYFLPSIIAILRHHSDRWLLVFLNIFAGWTGLFWIALLIWSLSSQAGRAGGAYPADQGRGPYGGPTPSPRPEDTLEQLARLRQRGVLSEEEFAEAKERIIGRM